jgi:hypothetical protein
VLSDGGGLEKLFERGAVAAFVLGHDPHQLNCVKAVADTVLGFPAQGRVHHLFPGGKFGGVVLPASLLDATHRNGRCRLSGNQKRCVDDPILLGPPQFLPFNEEDWFRSLVGQLQPVDVSRVVDFRDRQQPALDSLLQGQLIGFDAIGMQHREQGQVATILLFT